MVDQTNALTPGSSTSEGKGSKAVVIIASVISVLGTVTTVLDSLSNVIPAAQKGLGLWIAISGVVVAALTQVAYSIARSQVKIAAIKAGQSIVTSTVDPAAAAKNVGQ